MSSDEATESLIPHLAFAGGDGWRLLRCDLGAWGPALTEICRRHRIRERSLTPQATGTAVVLRTGELVIKIFRPEDRRDCDLEAQALAIISGRLPVPVPSLVARGDIGPCAYLVMTALDGEPMAEAWDQMDEHARVHIVEEVARGARALHELPVDQPESLHRAWNEFITEQRRTAAERQRACGLAPALCEQIDLFLDRASAAFSPPARLALLHTEIMQDHLLVRREGRRWQLSGLFDFADALIGGTEYEFPAIGLFVTCGDPRLLRSFLLAYGLSPAALTVDWSCRLLAWTLLHRYANLSWYLRRLPLREPAGRLEELAGRWFGLGG